MIFDTLLGLVIGTVLTAISYFLGLHFGWITDFSWLEFSGVVFNYACVLLTARLAMACWPTGIVAVLLLGALFWQLHLYASMALQLAYFLPMQFYGWYAWAHGGKNKTELPLSWMDLTDWKIAVMVGIVAWYVVAYLDAYFGAEHSFLDSMIFVLSILGQYYLNIKKVESWLFWIAVDVIAVYVYYKSGAELVAFQYALFLGNALYGLASWILSYFKEQKVTT